MGIFDKFIGNKSKVVTKTGFVKGPNKKSGGHDHRYNTGNDRTPAQKKGDESKKKQ